MTQTRGGILLVLLFFIENNHTLVLESEKEIKFLL